MLPVITVQISGKNNRHKQGNILLDSGAQISLICTSTAKNLDLKGKDVSITIRKVGGEEEMLATKVYQVPITSLESGAKFTVKAVGIPHISDDISNINIAMPIDPAELDKERRNTQAAFSLSTVPTVIDPTKFSKWKRLERVTAWILRYMRNLRLKSKPEDNVDPLTAVELEQAEELWIKTAQKELHERIEYYYYDY
ncbi:PREDICTED: uncharacterized protein LOC107334806 [Paramuricea clavata]|uniref:PREDICTED: uncharacterized protein LOC107334806 n=1 Tax=Paramuricea clavata TaxID=317549 RepID=A0A6S7GHR9_PARCT|nr:PREDICTED: uncharacterized protein LOC107334806 [Paramuricea clavata]